MKKVVLSVVLVMVMSVFMAGVAMANASVHGGYSTSTDACAGCHVTHASLGANLLTRSNQTDFCYTCHGDNASGSMLDTQNGVNKNYTDLNTGVPIGTATTAGGFNQEQLPIDSNDLSKGYHATFTSIHDLGNDALVPGGGNAITGGLQCGSCHNPHGSSNARILKTQVNGISNLSLSMTFTNDGKNQVASYTSGSLEWCSACHGKFNKAAGSGSTLTSGETMYRHAMGVSATLNADETNIQTGTPLEGGKVVCLTCHRAHGTKATANGVATTWHRDKDGTSASDTGSGSALLRMDNRGVCYNCHKDASQNF